MRWNWQNRRFEATGHEPVKSEMEYHKRRPRALQEGQKSKSTGSGCGQTEREEDSVTCEGPDEKRELGLLLLAKHPKPNWWILVVCCLMMTITHDFNRRNRM
ncbi:hypothetical protein P7K49_031760 [Saguinus oedipus]|uniref:Uncharacterized protein n=1 Tax=Saguinus oedipus TaxID=9490 RepID=A0ABQ9U152_SAGOE|nr:hypothetical protein P7K49_031760 [Saguinus oedipus]